MCTGASLLGLYRWQSVVFDFITALPSFAGKCALGSRYGVNSFIVRWRGKFYPAIALPFLRTSSLLLRT